LRLFDARKEGLARAYLFRRKQRQGFCAGIRQERLAPVSENAEGDFSQAGPACEKWGSIIEERVDGGAALRYSLNIRVAREEGQKVGKGEPNA
jgi:hypothetical protein